MGAFVFRGPTFSLYLLFRPHSVPFLFCVFPPGDNIFPASFQNCILSTLKKQLSVQKLTETRNFYIIVSFLTLSHLNIQLLWDFPTADVHSQNSVMLMIMIEIHSVPLILHTVCNFTHGVFFTLSA